MACAHGMLSWLLLVCNLPRSGRADVAPFVLLMIFTFSLVDVVLSSEKRLGYMASGSFIWRNTLVLHSGVTIATQSLSGDFAGCAAERELQEAVQRRRGNGLTRVLPGQISDTSSLWLICSCPERGQRRDQGVAESTMGA